MLHTLWFSGGQSNVTIEHLKYLNSQRSLISYVFLVTFGLDTLACCEVTAVNPDSAWVAPQWGGHSLLVGRTLILGEPGRLEAIAITRGTRGKFHNLSASGSSLVRRG